MTAATVVVIAYNYGRYLTEAVESVLAQTRRPRILVMDDASEDDTPDVAAALLRRGGTEGADIRYIRAPANQGLARTRNAAADLVATDWLIYLDADDWLAPEYIERGEAWLADRPELDVLTTDMQIVRNGRRHRLFKAKAPGSWQQLLGGNSVVQTSFIRTAVVRALGGYDPNLDFEDWDFWIRLLKAGHHIGHLPGQHVYRREHGANKSKLCDEVRATRQIHDKHCA